MFTLKHWLLVGLWRRKRLRRQKHRKSLGANQISVASLVAGCCVSNDDTAEFNAKVEAGLVAPDADIHNYNHYNHYYKYQEPKTKNKKRNENKDFGGYWRKVSTMQLRKQRACRSHRQLKAKQQTKQTKLTSTTISTTLVGAELATMSLVSPATMVSSLAPTKHQQHVPANSKPRHWRIRATRLVVVLLASWLALLAGSWGVFGLQGVESAFVLSKLSLRSALLSKQQTINSTKHTPTLIDIIRSRRRKRASAVPGVKTKKDLVQTIYFGGFFPFLGDQSLSDSSPANELQQEPQPQQQAAKAKHIQQTITASRHWASRSEYFAAESQQLQLGKLLMPAVRMALEHINANDSVLAAYKLEIVPRDTQCNATVSLKEFFDIIYEQPKKLLLYGDACRVSTDPIAKASHFFDLVQVSYADTDPIYSVENYPNFFRVVPSENELSLSRIPFIRHFNWTRVGTIYQNSPKFSLPHSKLLTELERGNITTMQSVSLPGSVESLPNNRDLGDELRKLKEKDVRIILGNFDETWALRLFCLAYKEQMFGRKYQWILTGVSDSRLWAQHSRFGSECSMRELIVAMDGYIVTDITAVSRSQRRTISGMMPHEYSVEYKRRANAETISDDENKFYGYAYDGVWAIADAVDSQLKHFQRKAAAGLVKLNKDIEGINSLLDFDYHKPIWAKMFRNALNRTRFIGVTGTVSFVKNQRPGLITLSQFQAIHAHSQVVIGSYDALDKALNLNVGMPILWRGSTPPIDHTIQQVTPFRISRTIFIVISVFAMLGIVLAIVFLFINIKFRNQRYIKMSSPYLNNLIIIGCILTYFSVIILGLDSSMAGEIYFPVVCRARAWVLMAGFTLAFGSMFSKTFRVHSIFTNIKLHKKVIKDYKLFLVVFILLTFDISILIVWQYVDPFYRETNNGTSIQDPDNEDVLIIPEMEHCQSSMMTIFLGIIYVYKGLLMAFGCFLAWETRRVSIPALNDSKYIGLSVYNVVIMCVIGASLSFVLRDQQDASFVIISIFIIFCSTTTLCLVFVPKVRMLIELKQNPRPDQRVRATLKTFKKNYQKYEPTLAEPNLSYGRNQKTSIPGPNSQRQGNNKSTIAVGTANTFTNNKTTASNNNNNTNNYNKPAINRDQHSNCKTSISNIARDFTDNACSSTGNANAGSGTCYQQTPTTRHSTSSFEALIEANTNKRAILREKANELEALKVKLRKLQTMMQGGVVSFQQQQQHLSKEPTVISSTPIQQASCVSNSQNTITLPRSLVDNDANLYDPNNVIANATRALLGSMSHATLTVVGNTSRSSETEIRSKSVGDYSDTSSNNKQRQKHDENTPVNKPTLAIDSQTELSNSFGNQTATTTTTTTMSTTNITSCTNLTLTTATKTNATTATSSTADTGDLESPSPATTTDAAATIQQIFGRDKQTNSAIMSLTLKTSDCCTNYQAQHSKLLKNKLPLGDLNKDRSNRQGSKCRCKEGGKSSAKKLLTKQQNKSNQTSARSMSQELSNSTSSCYVLPGSSLSNDKIKTTTTNKYRRHTSSHELLAAVDKTQKRRSLGENKQQQFLPDEPTTKTTARAVRVSRSVSLVDHVHQQTSSSNELDNRDEYLHNNKLDDSHLSTGKRNTKRKQQSQQHKSYATAACADTSTGSQVSFSGGSLADNMLTNTRSSSDSHSSSDFSVCSTCCSLVSRSDEYSGAYSYTNSDIDINDPDAHYLSSSCSQVSSNYNGIIKYQDDDQNNNKIETETRHTPIVLIAQPVVGGSVDALATTTASSINQLEQQDQEEGPVIFCDFEESF